LNGGNLALQKSAAAKTLKGVRSKKGTIVEGEALFDKSVRIFRKRRNMCDREEIEEFE